MRMISWWVTAAAAIAVLAGTPASALADEPPPGLRPSPTAAAAQVRKVEGRAEMVEVVLDLAKILKLDEPAKTIVIGNPAVLDATVNDERTLVLTGKVLGTTNMIVLDGEGDEVANLMINVVQGRHVVTVHRGTEKETYNCVGRCRPTVAAETGGAGTQAPPPQAPPATTGSVQPQ